MKMVKKTSLFYNVKEKVLENLGSIPLSVSETKVKVVYSGPWPILYSSFVEICSIDLCNPPEKPTNKHR